MARRRHDREEEDSDDEVFRYPEFDRKAYIEEEINRARASIVPIIYAIFVGIISAYIFLHANPSYAWPLTAFIGLSLFILVRYLYPIAGVDTGSLKKKDHISHAFMYFFAWLAIFIIFLNPPFVDYSAPDIEHVHLEGLDEHGNWTTYVAGENYSEFRVVAFVHDNTEVALVEINLNGMGWQRMNMTSDGLAYAVPADYSGHGSMTYQIRATDIYGHEVVESGTLP